MPNRISKTPAPASKNRLSSDGAFRMMHALATETPVTGVERDLVRRVARVIPRALAWTDPDQGRNEIQKDLTPLQVTLRDRLVRSREQLEAIQRAAAETDNDDITISIGNRRSSA